MGAIGRNKSERQFPCLVKRHPVHTLESGDPFIASLLDVLTSEGTYVIMHISSLSVLMVMELEIIELKASIKRDLFISKPQ